MIIFRGNVDAREGEAGPLPIQSGRIGRTSDDTTSTRTRTVKQPRCTALIRATGATGGTANKDIGDRTVNRRDSDLSRDKLYTTWKPHWTSGVPSYNVSSLPPRTKNTPDGKTTKKRSVERDKRGRFMSGSPV